MSAQGGAKGQTSRDFANVPHDSVDSMKYAPLPPEQQINRKQLKKKKKTFIVLIIIFNTATAINYN